MSDKIKNRVLSDGVVGCFIPTPRFKTARLSVCFYLPMNEDTASAYALLPFILTGCGKNYPTSRLISQKLDNLYGAALACECDKSGDTQVLRMSITCIENKYSLDGRDVVAECAKMLHSLIFEPLCDDGGFEQSNFEKEKRLMIERIDSEINNKRSYAISRCEAEMCKGEPNSIPRYGSRQGQVDLTRAELYAAWQKMLSTAFVRIGYLATEPSEKVFDIFTSAFSRINRNAEAPQPAEIRPAKATVSEISDRMSVKQGKLVLGFRTPVAGSDRDTYKLMVMSDLFGGGPYSRLFDNVREKMSLCYYCAARSNRRKGWIMVDSGVEFDNMDKAYSEILNQLDIMRRGEFTDDSLAASKLSLCDSFSSLGDSQPITDRWYADRVFYPDAPTPDELAELVRSVTRDDIVEMANSLTLDTVYRLLGSEEVSK